MHEQVACEARTLKEIWQGLAVQGCQRMRRLALCKHRLEVGTVPMLAWSEQFCQGYVGEKSSAQLEEQRAELETQWVQRLQQWQQALVTPLDREVGQLWKEQLEMVSEQGGDSQAEGVWPLHPAVYQQVQEYCRLRKQQIVQLGKGWWVARGVWDNQPWVGVIEAVADAAMMLALPSDLQQCWSEVVVPVGEPPEVSEVVAAIVARQAQVEATQLTAIQGGIQGDTGSGGRAVSQQRWGKYVVSGLSSQQEGQSVGETAEQLEVKQTQPLEQCEKEAAAECPVSAVADRQQQRVRSGEGRRDREDKRSAEGGGVRDPKKGTKRHKEKHVRESRDRGHEGTRDRSRVQSRGRSRGGSEDRGRERSQDRVKGRSKDGVDEWPKPEDHARGWGRDRARGRSWDRVEERFKEESQGWQDWQWGGGWGGQEGASRGLPLIPPPPPPGPSPRYQAPHYGAMGQFGSSYRAGYQGVGSGDVTGVSERSEFPPGWNISRGSNQPSLATASVGGAGQGEVDNRSVLERMVQMQEQVDKMQELMTRVLHEKSGQ